MVEIRQRQLVVGIERHSPRRLLGDDGRIGVGVLAVDVVELEPRPLARLGALGFVVPILPLDSPLRVCGAFRMPCRNACRDRARDIRAGRRQGCWSRYGHDHLADVSPNALAIAPKKPPCTTSCRRRWTSDRRARVHAAAENSARPIVRMTRTANSTARMTVATMMFET